MKMLAFAIMALLLAMPLAYAQDTYCSNANTLTYNKTYNLSGMITYWTETQPCPYGCDTTRGQCNSPLGTPLAIYIFFEAIAFLALMGTFWTSKKAEEVMLIFPVMSCVLFFILGYLGGTIIIDGEYVTSILSVWINMGMGLLALIISIYYIVADTGKQTSEYR